MVLISRPAALDSVFRALDRKSVCWCLLRPEPSHEKADDVDLLVATGDRRQLSQLLNEVGFARLPEWGHGSHRFFVGYDAPNDRWIHLDVVFELAFGPFFALKTAAAGDCLRRRRRVGDVWTLHPDDGFWTLLLHNLLDKQAVQAKHRDRLRSLAENARTENPLARELDALAAPEWRAARLLDYSRAGDWQTLERLSPGLVSAWMRRRRFKAAGSSVETRLARKMAYLSSRLLLHEFNVALVGLDGKATLAIALEASLPVPVRRMDMRVSPRAGRLGVLRRGPLMWSRYVVRRLYPSTGRILILDRYSFDALAVHSRHPTRAARAPSWLHGQSRPEPDLTLLFDSPPEPLHERARRRSAVVDASRDPAVVRRDVVALIWRAYCRDQRRSTAF
jgi:hypothetical protein